jgi:hypothetical protein
MQKKECLVLLCKNERPCWTCEIWVWACEPQQLTLVTVNFPKTGTYLFMYIILKRCIGILKEYLGKMRWCAVTSWSDCWLLMGALFTCSSREFVLKREPTHAWLLFWVDSLMMGGLRAHVPELLCLLATPTASKKVELVPRGINKQLGRTFQ